MENRRFTVMVSLSSDHAGIDRELTLLENELRRVFARIGDARKARDFVHHLAVESTYWCGVNDVDDRGWMEVFARRGV